MHRGPKRKQSKGTLFKSVCAQILLCFKPHILSLDENWSYLFTHRRPFTVKLNGPASGGRDVTDAYTHIVPSSLTHNLHGIMDDEGVTYWLEKNPEHRPCFLRGTQIHWAEYVTMTIVEERGPYIVICEGRCPNGPNAFPYLRRDIEETPCTFSYPPIA